MNFPNNQEYITCNGVDMKLIGIGPFQTFWEACETPCEYYKERKNKGDISHK